MKIVLQLLTWIGLTRKQRDGKWFVPFNVPPTWRIPRTWAALRGYVSWYGWAPYVFRNGKLDPWKHRRAYGRLLPFRWGIGWMGFEFGDRGGEHRP